MSVHNEFGRASSRAVNENRNELLHYSFTAENLTNRLINYASLGASSMDELSINPTVQDHDEVVRGLATANSHANPPSPMARK